MMTRTRMMMRNPGMDQVEAREKMMKRNGIPQKKDYLVRVAVRIKAKEKKRRSRANRGKLSGLLSRMVSYIALSLGI
jgi:hypothetical protein